MAFGKKKFELKYINRKIEIAKEEIERYKRDGNKDLLSLAEIDLEAYSYIKEKIGRD